jgi:hypothetical protein
MRSADSALVSGNTGNADGGTALSQNEVNTSLLVASMDALSVSRVHLATTVSIFAFAAH